MLTNHLYALSKPNSSPLVDGTKVLLSPKIHKSVARRISASYTPGGYAVRAPLLPSPRRPLGLSSKDPYNARRIAPP